jgi:hypothetical protein
MANKVWKRWKKNSEIADVLRWLERSIKRHLPQAQYQRGYLTAVGNLQTELQKIYDSETNIEMSWVSDGPVNDVERLGGEWRPEWFGPKDYTIEGKPIQ